MDDVTCAVPGCGERRSARRLCNSHYQQWYATGAYADLATLRPPKPDACSVDGCPEPVLARGMCTTHYRRTQKHGAEADLTAPKRGCDPAERLLAKLEVQPNGCWHWTDPTNEQGYGRFKVDGRNVLTHRFAYEYFVDVIPEGQDIDHLCHNADLACRGGKTCPHRRCCNPAHLAPCEHGQNALRSRNSIASINAAKTRCPSGHRYTARMINGKVRRVCDPCANGSEKRRFRERYGTDTEFTERKRRDARERQRNRRAAAKAARQERT